MGRDPHDERLASDVSLQRRFAPNCRCFGCGPANDKGLRLESYVDPERRGVSARWHPQAHHEAFDNMLNGGIIGALLDCHCNWAAAWSLMNRDQLPAPPCTVTARYEIKLLRPTPTRVELLLWAEVSELGKRRVEVQGELRAAGQVTATCSGSFVAVQPGHPAYHRW